MTTQHPITPPPELVTDWCGQLARENDYGPTRVYDIATQAARWGADMELEACCEWLRKNGLFETRIGHLRAARRPKPPSLKELALDELDRIPTHDNEGRTVGVDVSIIRRALEQLDALYDQANQ